MKYLFVLALLMSGCAHVSEYNQGCRDGVTEAARLRGDSSMSGGSHDIGVNEGVTEYFCNMLDARRKNQESKNK